MEVSVNIAFDTTKEWQQTSGADGELARIQYFVCPLQLVMKWAFKILFKYKSLHF